MSEREGACAPISELHIKDIRRADKGLWVAAARSSNLTLAEWLIPKLNAAAQEDLSRCRPPWAKSLTERTARCLINHCLYGKREVRALFESPDFDCRSIPNFGTKQHEEVLNWLKK